ncbi:MAG: TonB-dependent receptor plug domain-containing protein, partial [Candidatus Rokubacteria bacterium]|nr:TonB-dependent receptor plug domain-containing protein [Candidatus Rokubacteria bacterium]
MLRAMLHLAALAAAAQPGDVQDLTELSIEELLQVEVTSVSRKEQAVADSPAAIHVITQEDIRRSGHTSIPELLRMVPGVHVARIDAHSWMVTVRGFGHRFTDKLLVMIDGRTVYTNLFSGVFWDVQEIPLEEIERIEVIRGPGGTMWGANAVNGVINIITKSSKDTQGFLGHVQGGDEDRALATARYGAAMGESAWWRAWVHGFDRDSFEDPAGGQASDEWAMARAGVRFDWEAGGRDSFTVEGDLYDGRGQSAFPLLSTQPPFALAIDETFEF